MNELPQEFVLHEHQTINPTYKQAVQKLIEQHAPIIIQPTFDIRNGNGLLAAFYHIIKQCQHAGTNTQCEHIECVKSVILSLVYESEATYSAYDDESTRPSVNWAGTFCYRSYNYRVYHRTSDIDHLALHEFQFNQQTSNDELESSFNESNAANLISTSTYDAIHSTDFGGLQTWCRGDKSTVLCYSFMSHKDTTIKRAACRTVTWPMSDSDIRIRLDEWSVTDEQMRMQKLSESQRLDRIIHANQANIKQPTDRVVLYTTTSNHLMSPFDTNKRRSSADQAIHSKYPLFAGDRQLAERFSKCVIADKWTIFSLLPRFFDPRPRDLRKARRTWKNLHQCAVADAQPNAVPSRDSVIDVDNVQHSRIVTSDGVVLADMQQYEE
jgi:hypothetical protein